MVDNALLKANDKVNKSVPCLLLEGISCKCMPNLQDLLAFKFDTFTVPLNLNLMLASISSANTFSSSSQ